MEGSSGGPAEVMSGMTCEKKKGATMVSLEVLREQDERLRFDRLRMDDRRTAIPPRDAIALAEDLKKAIRGEVRFDKGSRALYATDGSNYRQVPIGVVVPRSKEDVVRTLEVCRKHRAPVLPRGGGTSLAGQCCNVAVVMDFTKYLHHPIRIDAARKLGWVEPGCVLDAFQTAAKKQGLVFGPDPATHSHCAIGGMLGNNSCGTHSLMSKNNGYGLRASDNLHELEIATYDGARFRVGATSPEELERIIAAGGRQGEIYRQLRDLINKYADDIRKGFPKIPRRVSGYNLDDLLPENGFHVARALCGSEGTLATTLEATLHLMPNPKAASLLLLGYPDVFQAADHITEILKYKPIGLEGIDDQLVHYEKIKGAYAKDTELLPPGNGWLYVEFGGETREETDAQAKRCMEELRRQPGAPSMKLVDDPQLEKRLWEVRENSLGSTAFVPGLPDAWEGWEDSAVPVDKIGAYLRDFKALLNKFNYKASLYGHFSQGVVHTRIPFDLYTREGIDKFHHFLEQASDLVIRYGGSYSGEHGDGQSRAEFLPKLFGPRLMEAFHEFKSIWDPQWKMNPGKVVEPYKTTQNLRLGPDFNPPQPETYFEYPADNHQFSRAALRCVGVGDCRREGEQTMCPSYMVTREEKHSTRGRARMLWEMLNGEVIDDGWNSKEVYESLDLCLACKGCKGDCPVNVDMATYKAEFLAHYFKGKLRPRNMFLFGFVHHWAHLAGIAPEIANFFTQTPGLSTIAKWIAGMDQRRQVPKFAAQPFKQWFKSHQPRNITGKPVILFADTFNNYFEPETAIATVEVLEDAGFHVIVNQRDMCCGRPLYDYGYLDTARKWLLDILDKMRPEIEAGIPMVVLEPSCWSVFYDEMPNILHGNKDADRLHQNTYLLADFLKAHAPDYSPPKMSGKALLHRHCHHKSELKHAPEHEKKILKEMGLDVQEPETGCCGMAGAFGYTEGEQTDVALACGERVLLPKVREAEENTILVSDGFSCKEQIRQCTKREGMHLAQVIQLAKRMGPTLRKHPERMYQMERDSQHREAQLRTLAVVTAGAIAAGVAVRLFARPSRRKHLV